MGVPKTKGVLRSSVDYMDIGDYIPCSYYANAANTPGICNSLGEAFETELPLDGATAPDGGFYFVKVDNGLLVADRVVHKTPSWGSFYNAGYIEPMLNTNFMRTLGRLTGDVSPYGVSSASSVFSSANATRNNAWNAFDGVISNDGWVSDGVTDTWLEYEFIEPRIITTLSIAPRPASVTSSPKVFEFEAYNSYTDSWDILASVSDAVYTSGRFSSFPIANDTAYRRYRLRMIERVATTYEYFSIGELILSDIHSIIRSLTGGVTYLGADGNPTTAANSTGLAWPPNNEFDTYILKFPQELIEDGFGVNDVFNHQTTPCFVQETLSGSTSNRVARGGADGLVSFSSIGASVNAGFRPVLEYSWS